MFHRSGSLPGDSLFTEDEKRTLRCILLIKNTTEFSHIPELFPKVPYFWTIFILVDFLSELNKIQREAVRHIQGPSLIIAGAGSGKTRVLTYRVAYLLSKDTPAHTILALTFTNKAAREMKERIFRLVGESAARYVWMGTFHSIFARILRNEAHLLGYPSSYTIYDTADSKNLIKTIVKEMRLDEKIYKPSEVFSRISSAKNSLITPDIYSTIPELTQYDKYKKRDRMGEIFKVYARRCRKAGAMDFDDLLLYTNLLFRDFPETLDQYRRRFRYILVDEYQDTNLAQYMILKKLSEAHKNISVVGDDAQSIYAFRGARIENILNFRKDYPEAKVFKLEQNYRSTRNIVDAANSLIRHNAEQISKEVFSEKDKGEKIKIVEAETDREEGFLVVNEIFDEHLSLRMKYNDFAVLYRTNAQSRVFEEALRKRNIPYRVYGSISFYHRKEIKDVLAYFRLVVNLRDDEALKRIINYPARGIGKTTLEKLEALANDTGKPMWEIVSHPEENGLKIHAGTQKKLEAFSATILEFADQQNQKDAYELAYEITRKSGILKDLHNGTAPEEVSKYENVRELLNGISEFIAAPEQEGRFIGLDEYLQNVTLLTDQDTETEELDTVKIMTVHAAKGLEFRHVFIAGMEENLFPSQPSVNSQRELEEERRLFYVALTRAKDRVTITYAKSRFRWGDVTFSRPSRFIREIDPRYLDYPVSDPVFPAAGTENEEYRNTGYPKRSFASPRSRPAGEKTHIISTGKKTDIPFVPDDPKQIQPGMEVEHARFGKGKVLQIEGVFPDTKATVFFKEFGQKQLLLKFAKLKIVKPVV